MILSIAPANEIIDSCLFYLRLTADFPMLFQDQLSLMFCQCNAIQNGH
jgi:hypothetical protein